MTTCTNAPITTQTVTTADSQKTTYIYLQNAQESGHTSNQINETSRKNLFPATTLNDSL